MKAIKLTKKHSENDIVAAVSNGVISLIIAIDTRNSEPASVYLSGQEVDENNNIGKKILWKNENLKLGDQINFEIIDVELDEISDPVLTTEADQSKDMEQERKYYEKLKQKFEGSE